MNTYVHHVSGRLRLRLPQLKGHSGRAREAEKVMSQISGVTSADVNIVTGSLLMRYDPTGIDRDTLLNAVHLTAKRLGLNEVPELRGERRTGVAISSLADRAVSIMLEKLIERSAVALVGALL